MSNKAEWKRLFDEEMRQAEKARFDKNEGRARVCARRAAGILIGAYLSRRKIPKPGISVIERFRVLENLPDISTETKQIIHHLLLRVDHEHTLPAAVDLIVEVRQLEQELMSSDVSRHLEGGEESK